MTRPTLPGVNLELANAIRKLNALYNQIPEPNRPDVDSERWRALEATITAACRIGDRNAALAAIDAWQEHGAREMAAAMEVATGSGAE